MSGVFIHFPSTDDNLSVDLSEYGFEARQIVEVTSVGTFNPWVDGDPPFNTDTFVNFSTSYSGLTQQFDSDGEVNGYFLNEGTKLSIINDDAPVDDNDDNGDYGVDVQVVALYPSTASNVDFNHLFEDEDVAAAALIQAISDEQSIYDGPGGNYTVTLRILAHIMNFCHSIMAKMFY